MNGKPVGVLWSSPFELALDGAVFDGKREIVLEFETANTFLNCVDASDDPTLKDRLQGHYAAYLKVLDAEYQTGGLYGPVTLTDYGEVR